MRRPTTTLGRLACGQSGFSLVELSIALAIMGVLAVSSLPFLQLWKEKSDLRDAAAGIANVMISARMKAVVDRTDYRVSVDYAADGISAPAAVGAVAIKGSVDLYQDTTDLECPSLASGSVVFKPNGTAGAAGFEAVYLKSRSSKVQARYRVKILGATGKVSVEKWTGGTWVGA